MEPGTVVEIKDLEVHNSDGQKEVHSGRYVIEELLPYEPSNYVHEDTVVLVAEDGDKDRCISEVGLDVGTFDLAINIGSLVPCPECKGSGEVHDNPSPIDDPQCVRDFPCPACHMEGYVSAGRAVQIHELNAVGFSPFLTSRVPADGCMARGT